MVAKNGDTEIAKLLLDKGADIEAKDEDGLTALHLAAREGHTDTVKLLLKKEVDLNAKMIKEEKVPLEIRTEIGEREKLK